MDLGRTSSPLLDSRLATPIAQMRSICCSVYILCSPDSSNSEKMWSEDIVSREIDRECVLGPSVVER